MSFPPFATIRQSSTPPPQNGKNVPTVWVGFDTGEHDEICSIVKPISPVSRSTIVDFIGTTPAIKSDGWLVIARSSLIIEEEKYKVKLAICFVFLSASQS